MLLRDALGETLRDARTSQNRTLRDVSMTANVSLGYLSEVERGRKEASSELLAAICDALDLDLSEVLDTVSRSLRRQLTSRQDKVGANSGLAKASTPAVENAPGTRGLRIVLPYPARAGAPVS